MNEAWMVSCYNGMDAGFGYACGAVTVKVNCTKAFAKAYARHMNKVAPDFMVYIAEREPERYW